ncbi:uncharacterized protein LOC115889668 [Sitophilus oryzae]|uniref:Uncharacterized protein LOC115889668 n=1 Tax=Sitophilus oryzae TaxID=7048 RepID=A0A6J2YNL1_SITOR|nr:uncharacterized protein LOC115889668 [Sitophilus oryzae]
MTGFGEYFVKKLRSIAPNSAKNKPGGAELQTDSVRNRLDEQSDAGKDGANGVFLRTGTIRRQRNGPAEDVLPADQPTTTKAGKVRQRMKWTDTMNLHVMRCYYTTTNLETTPLVRSELLKMFLRKFPDYTNITEQRLVDQKRIIITKKYISELHLEELKHEVAEELNLSQPNLAFDEISNEKEPETEINLDINQATNQLDTQSIPTLPARVELTQITDIDEKHLETEFQTLLIEYTNMNPICRPKLPKQNNSRKLIRYTKIMDENILPKYLPHITNFLDLHTHIYAAAAAIIKASGGRIQNIERKHNKDQKEPWEMRLEIGIANTLKQKLKAKAGRIRRYRESTQRRKQNMKFNTSQRAYYRNLKINSNQPVGPLPTEEEIENYWSSIWSQPVNHNTDSTWIRDIEAELFHLPTMEPITITSDLVAEVIRLTQNWKAAGPDGIHNFWVKRLKSTHTYIAKYFTTFIESPETIPEFLGRGNTYLLPKSERLNNPTKYRPITCLCTLYKILTACIAKSIYKHVEDNKLLSEEQKGCVKKSQGCKEQLIIDSVILEQAANKRRNIYTAFIDYKKAFDSVPHSWLLKVLQIYKIDHKIINMLQHLMSTWNTVLEINQNQGIVISQPISVQRGIFQGDSLSPLWFCLALNPLSSILNKTGYGFHIKYDKTQHHVISHLMYMDDIKLFAGNEKQLQHLLEITKTFSKDIQMSFGLDKCKLLNIKQGRIISSGFDLGDGDIIESLEEHETYKYLGLAQGKRLQHKDIKEKITSIYISRLTNILKSKLNGKNTFTAINSYAIPIISYTFGTIKWTKTELENIQIKTRTTLTKFRAHHPKAAVERLTLPRNKGGRGLIDLRFLHAKQIYGLQQYFLHQASGLHRAVVRADNKHTPLDLQHAVDIRLPSDVIYEREKVEEWTRKVLHGRFPHELNQTYVDQDASNKWLSQADLFLETEGFMLSIQDQVIATRNYRKFILKEPNVVDQCRRCHEPGETIQHVTAGCRVLAPTSYLQRHDQVAKIIHQKLATLCHLKEDITPYYRYEPENVLENAHFKLYWNRSILTDKTTPHNRPDLTFTIKERALTYLIDVGIPNTHNLQSTWSEKLSKYTALAEQVKSLWKQNEVNIVPIIISSTGVIPKALHHSLKS